MIQREDDEGLVGVKIGKELMKVAGMALRANIMRLGPLVLPVSEQLLFAGNFVARKARLRLCPGPGRGSGKICGLGSRWAHLVGWPA